MRKQAVGMGFSNEMISSTHAAAVTVESIWSHTRKTFFVMLNAILSISTGSSLFKVFPLILRTFAISSDILRLKSWLSFFK